MNEKILDRCRGFESLFDSREYFPNEPIRINIEDLKKFYGVDIMKTANEKKPLGEISKRSEGICVSI